MKDRERWEGLEEGRKVSEAASAFPSLEQTMLSNSPNSCQVRKMLLIFKVSIFSPLVVMNAMLM